MITVRFAEIAQGEKFKVVNIASGKVLPGDWYYIRIPEQPSHNRRSVDNVRYHGTSKGRAVVYNGRLDDNDLCVRCAAG